MTVVFLHNWILRIVILGLFPFFSSCGANGNNNRIEHMNQDKIISKSYFELCDEVKDSIEYFVDTIMVKTTEELINEIRSNRVLKLVGYKYSFDSTLHIDNIENLKIIGTGFSELMIFEKNATVINLLNSHNISLESLIIGHSENQGHIGKQGILRIEHSSNISISNCKLLGYGTFGLVTNDVCNLKFANSEITECTAIIFEFEKSRKFEFEYSKFQNNNLSISVLGGFTNSTKEIAFLNCEFLNNKPDMTGNPAFNFMDNWEDFDEKIIFKNCTFKNNKGYKWYGDKIKLDNCKIDSSDFIGLQRNN